MLDEIKAILSPAGAWLWAELGNTEMKTTSNIIINLQSKDNLKIEKTSQ